MNPVACLAHRRVPQAHDRERRQAASDVDLDVDPAGVDTVATSVGINSYPSLATTFETNGDLWLAYAKKVDSTTRAIYARFLDYPAAGWALHSLPSLWNQALNRFPALQPAVAHSGARPPKKSQDRRGSLHHAPQGPEIERHIVGAGQGRR